MNRSVPIVVSQEGYSTEHFILPPHYLKDLKTVLIPHGLILDRIEKLAHSIINWYDEQELHVICISKGSHGFFNQLLSSMNTMALYNRKPNGGTPPYMEHYVRIKSKGSGLQIISEDLSKVLEGKQVLVVQDIIHTGATINQCVDYLAKMKPLGIRVASLLEKRTPTSTGLKGDFVGFLVPADEFIVGFSFPMYSALI
eukprot:Filipodium_phascolosomae@DN7047_c0_g1_i1.p1